MNQPIFITGVERSGSSLIARIFNICGAFKGTTTQMYENIEIKFLSDLSFDCNGSLFVETKDLTIPVDWKKNVDDILIKQGYKNGIWMFKSSKLAQTWPIWHYAYPNAKWIIVRRRTADIIHSCIETSYMHVFKSEENQKKIQVNSEANGWLWWVHQYEKKFVEMIEAGLNCKIIWPERMVVGDYQQVYEAIDWAGLRWNSNVVKVIDPLLYKSRRKQNGSKSNL